MNNQIDNIKSKTIKKLAQQCTTYHKVDFGMYEESGVDLEKFAELIIKEHLSIWHQMDNGNKVEGYVEMEDYPRAILKYFGIK